MSSPEPTRAKNTFKETRSCLPAAYFISNGNGAYSCGTKYSSYSFLELQPASLFILFFICPSCQFKLPGMWLSVFFPCTTKGCSVLVWGKCSRVFYFLFFFQTGLRSSTWEVCERRQPICYQLRSVSQSLSIKLLTAPPSVVKHVNVIELYTGAGNSGVWVAVESVGEQGVSLSCRLFGQRKLMWRLKWA